MQQALQRSLELQQVRQLVVWHRIRWRTRLSITLSITVKASFLKQKTKIIKTVLQVQLEASKIIWVEGSGQSTHQLLATQVTIAQINRLTFPNFQCASLTSRKGLNQQIGKIEITVTTIQYRLVARKMHGSPLILQIKIIFKIWFSRITGLWFSHAVIKHKISFPVYQQSWKSIDHQSLKVELTCLQLHRVRDLHATWRINFMVFTAELSKTRTSTSQKAFLQRSSKASTRETTLSTSTTTSTTWTNQASKIEVVSISRVQIWESTSIRKEEQGLRIRL